MSTTTGPDGESIGHLSFPPGVNPMGSPSNDGSGSGMLPYNMHQQHEMFRDSSHGNLNGASMYQNNISMQEGEVLFNAGTSDGNSGQKIVPHIQQQNVSTLHDSFNQAIMNVVSFSVDRRSCFFLWTPSEV